MTARRQPHQPPQETGVRDLNAKRAKNILFWIALRDDNTIFRAIWKRFFHSRLERSKKFAGRRCRHRAAEGRRGTRFQPMAEYGERAMEGRKISLRQ